MRDPFRRLTWFVIHLILFLLLLSTCGKLLVVEFGDWRRPGTASRL
jgi:hypothetical protein